jgi:hypothetical protein
MELFRNCGTPYILSSSRSEIMHITYYLLAILFETLTSTRTGR